RRGGLGGPGDRRRRQPHLGQDPGRSRPLDEGAAGGAGKRRVSEPYNRFTGQSLEHLTALSDGLFAVAMTLLVLDLRVPVSAAGTAYSEHGLAAALLRQGPNFAAYLLSFTMLGTFWLAQHTLLGILGRCDRTLTWINLGFLFVVSHRGQRDRSRRRPAVLHRVPPAATHRQQ